MNVNNRPGRAPFEYQRSSAYSAYTRQRQRRSTMVMICTVCAAMLLIGTLVFAALHKNGVI